MRDARGDEEEDFCEECAGGLLAYWSGVEGESRLAVGGREAMRRRTAWCGGNARGVRRATEIGCAGLTWIGKDECDSERVVEIRGTDAVSRGRCDSPGSRWLE
jgi:hypothetical protein